MRAAELVSCYFSLQVVQCQYATVHAQLTDKHDNDITYQDFKKTISQ